MKRKDYLAIIKVGHGSGSYATGKNQKEVVARVVHIAKEDWRLAPGVVIVKLYDVTDADRFTTGETQPRNSETRQPLPFIKDVKVTI